MREGLRSLESLGLIYSRRGEGRYVRGFNLDPILENLHYSLLFDTEDVREMIEVRERLEVGFIGDAIAAMDPETLSELRALVTEMRQRALSGEYFLDKDLEFHAAIYRPINNHVLSKLLDVFHAIYRNLRDRSLLVTRNPVIRSGQPRRDLERDRSPRHLNSRGSSSVTTSWASSNVSVRPRPPSHCRCEAPPSRDGR